MKPAAQCTARANVRDLLADPHRAVIALPRALLLERPQYLLAPDTVRLLARMIHTLLTTPDLETRR
ncbi:hypothetical protein NVV93_09380 [Pseudomonas sp. LS44]|uniref:hypothetical protein n=1 Tax=Pseudomonas sp. LS44 TaxID=1357074 RepID=UPI00215B20F1|nr:hypothetical protein [Pseudomonas sp. LS44]UVE19558.1 hypothetical protein NVV93_09380 [Pseudomonas sp. LS44]